MSSYYEQAENRLNKEVKDVKGSKEIAMKNAVKDALLSFCRQDEEFAQAVVQGGSFADCMSAVAKGVTNSISDLEAYRKAVTFYFPGAGISMVMTIDLLDSVRSEPSAEKSAIKLDIADFL